MKSIVNAALQPKPSVPKPVPSNGSKYSRNPAPSTRRRLLSAISSASECIAVLAEARPEQPVRVDPDGPAPVAPLVEPLAEQVVARDDEADPRRSGWKLAECRSATIASSCSLRAAPGRAAARTTRSCPPRCARAGSTSRAQNRRVSGSHSSASIAAWSRCGSLAMRAWVLADDRGDLGQRVRRPQQDRREQRAGDDERHGVHEPRVVIPGVPVAGGEVHEPVVGLVRRPVLGVAVGEVVPDVRRDSARGITSSPRSRSQAGELSRPDSHGWTTTASPMPAGSRAIGHVGVLGDESRIQPAQERPRRVDIARVSVHLERRPGVDGRLGDAGRLDVARRARRCGSTTARRPGPGSRRPRRPTG